MNSDVHNIGQSKEDAFLTELTLYCVFKRVTLGFISRTVIETFKGIKCGRLDEEI